MGMTAIVIGIAISAIGGLLRSEAEAWAPWLAIRVLRLAVRRAPAELRDRMDEEWRAHLTEVPGAIGKLIVAFGFLRASHQMPDIARLSGQARFQKRVFDLAIAVPMIVFLAPMLMLVAFAIKMSSRGPVMFRQVRNGSDGRRIMIYKFRSMYLAAEKPAGGDDRPHRRITPVGRLLRITSLDELPQLFNVLNGDMTIVGPRPGMPWHEGQSTLKPGLTGLDRDETPEAYAEQWSLGREMRALLRTVMAVMRTPPPTGSEPDD
jgi:lipopolysaccharide/colanic/teichoic acid biosynthesis glycosyltransferase